MEKTVAVSFEEDRVKIVYASLKGSTLSIEKTDVVPNAEFDVYLKKVKASNFVVTSEFREAYHGILTAPVVKPAYLKKIVESSIRKALNHPNFSFIYSTLGERVIDNKKVLEVFYYAVKTDDVKKLVGRFYERGKTVSALYPSVFAAAAVVDLIKSGDTRMGIYGTGREKVAFFTKNGCINFIRNYESSESELTDFDVQNINMTISYCFQNIRISPASILLIGNLSRSAEIKALPTAPLACMYNPRTIACDHQTYMEYILPISSFYAGRSSNILNRDFKNIYYIRNYMTYAVRAFAAVVLICLGLIVLEAVGIADKEATIKAALRSHTDLEALYTEYSEKKETIREFMPVVSFVNRQQPDLRKLLIALTQTDLKELSLNSIDAATKDQQVYTVVIKGTGSGETYTSLQTSFERMASFLKNIPGIEVTGKTLDLSARTFSIVLDYREQE